MHSDDDHGPTRRDLLAQDIAERTGIDEPMIERLVRSFYARAREDMLIGPVFEAHVSEWEPHIAKMCQFWSSVALMTGRYHGQPMAAHLPLPVDSRHFDRWLTVFEATAKEVCPPAAAGHFVERARRIAESMELGLAFHRGRRLERGQRLPPLACTAEREGERP